MKKNTPVKIVLTILTIFSALPFVSLAQAGSLDLSFDTDGKVITNMGSSDCAANAVVIQSDGRIVAVGYSGNGSTYDFAIARYNTDGGFDTTFDTDGKVTTAIGSYNTAFAVALQSDGKIIAAGSANGSQMDFALVRYNTNGSLDTTFDIDGKVITAVGNFTDVAYSVAIQNDGKIVMAGYSSNGSNDDFSLVRYNTNGSLDSTFDNDGKVITPIGNLTDWGFDLAIQIDGKIVVAGWSDNGTKYDFAMTRYNTNGSLDTTFDTDGKVTTSIGSSNDFAYSLAIQNDGKIVLAGTSNTGSNEDIALVRYNSNGSIDSTFDADGIVVTPIGLYGDRAKSVSIQNDGKILVAGGSTLVTTSDFALLRYNANGSLDNTFDIDGIVTTPIGIGSDIGYSVATQNDGKIVIAGFSHDNTNYAFALARYNYCTTMNLMQSLAICAGQSINIGGNTYSVTGVFIDTFTASIYNCDSIVTTNLTVLPLNTFSQSSIICSGQSVTVGSNTYAISGIYLDTLLAINACDSIVTTNLTVTPMPILTTSVIGIVITSNQVTAGYQWIDCNNNNLPITGETNQSYTATVNGNYAVVVTLGLCADTSACVSITSVGVDQLSNRVGEISIYPNPFSSSTMLQTDYLLINATLNVYNLYGQQVKLISNLYGHTITLYRDNLPSGLYFIRLTQGDKIILRNKLVITD